MESYLNSIMDINGNELKINADLRRMFDEQVHVLLRDIQEHILKAHADGQNTLSYELQSQFEIPYTINKDAQRKIYYHILKELDEKKFHPKIKFANNGNDVTLYVKWYSPMAIKEKQLQDEYIQTKLVGAKNNDNLN